MACNFGLSTMSLQVLDCVEYLVLVNDALWVQGPGYGFVVHGILDNNQNT